MPSRRRFWVAVLPLVAIAAFLNAQAIAQLVGVAVGPAAEELAAPPPAVAPAAVVSASVRSARAAPILARNPFDHVAGSLVERPAEPAAADQPLDTVDDPYAVAACDGVDVLAIAASEDPDWSFVALAAADGKSQLRRRGGDVGGKTVFFIGGDRIWLAADGALCQASLFAPKKRAKPVVARPTSSAAPASSAAPRGGKPLDPAIKKGIQRISATEFQIDRGVLDRILENQAELMRQARVVPEQENGRVVGIRLVGIRPDSLLMNLGMQNGDRLQTINGFEMGSPEKALEAYARLRTADKLTIQIQRGGKPVNLDYAIR